MGDAAERSVATGCARGVSAGARVSGSDCVVTGTAVCGVGWGMGVAVPVIPAILIIPAVLVSDVTGVAGWVASLAPTVDVGAVVAVVAVVIVAVVALAGGVDEDAVIVSCGIVV